MKKLIKEILVREKCTPIKSIISILATSSAKLVSFDIFDTLIKRNIREATDVFSLLEKAYVDQFGYAAPVKKWRIIAEKEANKRSPYNDVNLDEIYQAMKALPEEERKWLKKKEVELELKITQKNNRLFDVYQWCLAHGKRIILISDMYLPLDVVEEIVKNAGYHGYAKIYLSNCYRERKATGNLFKIALKEEGVSPKEMVHIGDALRGDYLSPLGLGIQAILIKRKDPETKYFNSKRYGLDYNLLNSFIRNNEPAEYDFYQKIGYEVVGPILYGYSKWLSETTKKSGIHKLFFLAREGFLLERAFRLVSENKQDYCVIRVSRKATALPLLQRANNLDDILNRITVTRTQFTVENLLSACEIDEKTARDILQKIGISSNVTVHSLNNHQKEVLFLQLFPFIKEFSRNQEKYIRGYLKGMGFVGKVAVCDVGWHGTIQNALQEIFSDVDITGFYIGKKERKTKKHSNSVAFLFDDHKNHQIQAEVMSAPDIFELFFLSVDGSAKKYAMDSDGKYFCVQAKPEQTRESAKNVINLQDAACHFIEDFKEFDDKIGIAVTPKTCEAAYSKFINPPSMETVHHLNQFSFLNVGSHRMGAEHNLFYYSIHPKDFVDEFLNKGSKAIFLKSVFRLPLPYANMIDFLRKFDRL